MNEELRSGDRAGRTSGGDSGASAEGQDGAPEPPVLYEVRPPAALATLNRPERRNALAIRWIIAFAKNRSGQSMAEKLAGELLDAYNKRGAAVKKREDTHKMAEANKAFAHYRW